MGWGRKKKIRKLDIGEWLVVLLKIKKSSIMIV